MKNALALRWWSNAAAIAIRCKAWSFSIVGCVSIGLLVVGRAAQILVRQRGTGRGGILEREPVLLVDENVFDRAIAIGAQPLGAPDLRTGLCSPTR